MFTRLSLNFSRHISYQIVFPARQSPRRKIPPHILKPNYAEEGLNLVLKSSAQQQKIRDSCKLAREALDLASSLIKPGVATDYLDEVLHKFIISKNAYPSPLGYKNFPKSICTSVNNVACHGIPDDRELLDGDIINVDVTVFFNGYHGDVSETFSVGNCDKGALKLIEIARECRDEGIKVCGPGVPLNRIGQRVQLVRKKSISKGYFLILITISENMQNDMSLQCYLNSVVTESEKVSMSYLEFYTREIVIKH